MEALIVAKWVCLLVILVCLTVWIRRRLAKPEQPPFRVDFVGIVNHPEHGQVVAYEVRPRWDYKED